MSLFNSLGKKINHDSILISDFDGTLVFTDIANNLAYQEAIKVIVGNDIDVCEFRMTSDFISREYPKNAHAIITLKQQLYQKYLSTVSLNTALFEVIKHVYRTNLVYLITKGNKNRVMQIMQYLNIEKYFANLFFCNKQGCKYTTALDMLHVDLSNVFIIENDYSEVALMSDEMRANCHIYKPY